MSVLDPSRDFSAGSAAPHPNRRAWKSILRDKRTRVGSDVVLLWLARLSAVIIVAMLGALVVVLVRSAWPSIRAFGLSFIASSAWKPREDLPPAMQQYGALPVIYGTAVTSVLALIFAVPLSLGAALFLVRVAPRLRVGGIISFLIEFLAAIPSIAYGIWGMFVLAPFLRDYVEPAVHRVLGNLPMFHWLFFQPLQIGKRVIQRPLPLNGNDMLDGGLILGIMILPIITAVGRDVLRAVPRSQIEGTMALGATWWQSSREMLRYGRSGLFGAVMLGLARAAGETMAVTMVIGNKAQIVPSLFAPAQTMSSLLANEFVEASGVLHRSALVEVALVLLLMSLAFNIVARYLVVGKGSRTAAAH